MQTSSGTFIRYPDEVIFAKPCSHVTIYYGEKSNQYYYISSNMEDIRWFSGGAEQTDGALSVSCTPNTRYWRNEDVLFIHCYHGCGEFTFGIKCKQLLQGDKSCHSCDLNECLGAYDGYDCVCDCAGCDSGHDSG